jgi:2-methylisocitrate lyase-like PEP mutase family enzyme
VNVLARPTFSVRDLTRAGARRISVGGGFARAAWSGFLDVAREVQQRGSFTALGRAVPGGEINGLF